MEYGTYLLLMVYLTAVKIALTAMPDVFRSPAQAAVFAWPMIGALTALGLGGVWLSRRVGLPGLLDSRVSGRERFLLPAALGVLLGLMAIGTDLATGWTRDAAARLHLTSIHIAWPASALIYPGGAIIVDVIYYLIPIPLLIWVVSRATRVPAESTALYWTIGLLAAAIEPVTQDLGQSGGAGVMAVLFAEDLALNVVQVWLFRRAGFLAAVTARISFYAVWHVLWGLNGG